MWRFCLRQYSQHAATANASTVPASKTRRCAPLQQLLLTQPVWAALDKRQRINAHNSPTAPTRKNDKRANKSPPNFRCCLRPFFHFCCSHHVANLWLAFCYATARRQRQRQKRMGNIAAIVAVSHGQPCGFAQRERSKRQTERQNR